MHEGSGNPARQRRLRSRWPLALPVALALAGTPGGGLRGSAAPLQAPAPYGLFPVTDCAVQSAYSPETKSTTVQLSLVPPGPDGAASAVSLVLRAVHPGREPAGPPGAIEVLALPAITSNPNIERNVDMELLLEYDKEPLVRLFYFGQSWGQYGYVGPGAEVTRVVFSLSSADLQALLLAKRVTGRVMNYHFELTSKQLAALRQFASTIGVPDPAEKRTAAEGARRD